MDHKQTSTPADKMRAEESALLLIDVQARLAPAIHEVDRVTENVAKLIAGARRLEVPVLATEHCPEAIGSTLPELRAQLQDEEIYGKRHFDACAEAGFREKVARAARHQWVLCGTEAHVCLLQAALGLRQLGAAVFVVADATGSRAEENKRLALERMRHAGCVIVTTEMVLFEWLHHADNPAFKEILRLIK